MTLSFDGPVSSEQASPNPFLDYRLDVSFSHASGAQLLVPGFFAADGDAADSGADSGDQWQVRFAPPLAGQWTFQASFVTGVEAAINGLGSPTSFDGLSGSLTIQPSNKSGRDFRGKGLLRHVANKRYWQFAESGEIYFKGGANSPENLLAYQDFDGTYRQGGGSIHSYQPHASDAQPGDPTWRAGKGASLLGALNYLASRGMNAVYFLTMNIEGDGKDVWPYTGYNERERFDVSKLAQWQNVFSHMTAQGLMLHVVLQETENDQLLDGGSLGKHRRLYLRELIARFAHHPALCWNLGEENTNTDQQRVDFTNFIHGLDPWQHPIVCHTNIGDYQNVYSPLLGQPGFAGASLQTNNTIGETRTWVEQSIAAGHPWAVYLDEVAKANEGVKPDAVDPGHDEIRKGYLWPNLMAGGAGVEWYFGYSYPHDDLGCEDWRSREHMWDLTDHALEFMRGLSQPNLLRNNDTVTQSSQDYVLCEPGRLYVVYAPHGGPVTLDLSGYSASFEVSWFDPRNGGGLQNIHTVQGGAWVSLGNPPSSASADWVVRVERQ